MHQTTLELLATVARMQQKPTRASFSKAMHAWQAAGCPDLRETITTAEGYLRSVFTNCAYCGEEMLWTTTINPDVVSMQKVCENCTKERNSEDAPKQGRA